MVVSRRWTNTPELNWLGRCLSVPVLMIRTVLAVRLPGGGELGAGLCSMKGVCDGSASSRPTVGCPSRARRRPSRCRCRGAWAAGRSAAGRSAVGLLAAGFDAAAADDGADDSAGDGAGDGAGDNAGDGARISSQVMLLPVLLKRSTANASQVGPFVMYFHGSVCA